VNKTKKNVLIDAIMRMGMIKLVLIILRFLLRMPDY